MTQTEEQTAISAEQLNDWHQTGKMKYQVINVLARRARQINEGERAVVPNDGLDPTTTAIAELRAHRLHTVTPDRDEDFEDVEI